MIRFGIAGFGLHAGKRLMPGFGLARNCKVVALSRRDQAKAREAAKQFGIPDVFASTEELSRCPEVDAVFIVTPNVCHLADVRAAAAAGKPVLCEKPMAMNAGECREMIEAAHSAGVVLGVAHVFRFEESTASFRRHIAEGDIGRPVLARAEFSFPAVKHSRAWIYTRAIAGGGPIADVGVHCVDALRYVLQDEVTRIGALGHSDERSGDVEAVASLTLEFKRGTLAAVLVSMRAQYRTPLEIVGDSGVVRADDALNVETPVTIELRRDGRIVSKEKVSNQLAYARQVDAFAAALEGGPDFPCPGEEGLKNQLCLDAAYRSLHSGKTEPVEATS